MKIHLLRRFQGGKSFKNPKNKWPLINFLDKWSLLKKSRIEAGGCVKLILGMYTLL